MTERKYRGLELWDVEHVPPFVWDAALAAALAVLDAEGVSPIEARHAQLALEAIDDRGALDDPTDPVSCGVIGAHLSACRRAEAAARQVVARQAPYREAKYLRLGVARWALDQFESSGVDPTKFEA